MPGVVVKIDYQLKVEHALDVSKADVVVFADAQAGGRGPYEFLPAEPDRSADVSSHDLTPGAVLALAHMLFDATPHAFTLGISGIAFERIEEGLSDGGKRNLDLAEEFLLNWLSNRPEGEADPLRRA